MCTPAVHREPWSPPPCTLVRYRQCIVAQISVHDTLNVLLPRACQCIQTQAHTNTGASRTCTSWQQPLTDQALARGLAPLAPAVALGKFDALHQVRRPLCTLVHWSVLTLGHQGHQALARACSTQGMQPWMLSFSGMAQVLGWPQRLPLVAPQQRCASSCCVVLRARQPQGYSAGNLGPRVWWHGA